MQANRARTVLIQQMQAFFVGNGIDAFIGPSVNETFMGNVVGLPQMVIPVAFNPVTSSSSRRNPTTVGIYALPNQDSKVGNPLLCVLHCIDSRANTCSSALLCQPMHAVHLSGCSEECDSVRYASSKCDVLHFKAQGEPAMFWHCQYVLQAGLVRISAQHRDQLLCSTELTLQLMCYLACTCLQHFVLSFKHASGNV